MSRALRRRLLFLLVIVAVVVAGLRIRPSYVIFRAGPAIDTLGDVGGTPLVGVTSGASYPTGGSLYLTTVSQMGGPGHAIDGWDLVLGWIDPEAEVVSRDQVFPEGVTADRVKQATTAQMTDSQHSAVAVALRALGRPEDAVVGSVVRGAPADGRLREGDVIVAVAGSRVRTTTDVGRLLQTRTGTVALTVRRGGHEQQVEITPTAQGGRRIIGVGLRAAFRDAPTVGFHAGEIGGPSAGMMFSLAVYDKLTPGALTGGQRIAGTGEMSVDGAVKPIGGIVHKMHGAQRSGVSWFLAPAANCAEVVGNVPEGMYVARVSSFDEARHAVTEIAAGRGRGLPTCAAAAQTPAAAGR